MLLFSEFGPEEDQPHKKKINGAIYCGIRLNHFPCTLHIFTPMNIIKNENRFFTRLWKASMKIIEGWFFPFRTNNGHLPKRTVNADILGV